MRLQLRGGQGAFSSHSVQPPGSLPEEGYVLRLTFILKENDKANKSTWAQLKSGGSDLSCVRPLPSVERVLEALLCELL